MRPISVIGGPSSAGAYAPGQEQAPRALREAGLITQLTGRGVRVRDRGDLPVQRWTPDPTSPLARNVDRVVANITGVGELVRSALADGELALVLGGDCTTGLGTIQAMGEQGVDHGVIYLDLHADMNVPDSVSDGALDWMGLAHALDVPGCVPAVSASCSLAPEQVVLLGFAEGHATDFERRYVAELGLAVITREELAFAPAGAARRALAAAGDLTALAVHFDVDLIDFNDAPLSEHTGANQGVTFAQALATLDALVTDPRVTALTVTEVNPLHGAADGSTLARLSTALADTCAHWASAAATGARIPPSATTGPS
jgi:arginase